jgi:hypothetical protein
LADMSLHTTWLTWGSFASYMVRRIFSSVSH